MKAGLRIGTRGSRLAVVQAEMLRSALLANGIESEIAVIKTKGDIEKNKPLYELGDKGLFVREIENKLTDGSVDVAVHSLKDLPSGQREGLVIAAYLPREAPNDVFISEKYSSPEELSLGAKAGTGSLKRKSQLLVLKQGVDIVPVRGNVDTRIKKAETGEYDCLIMAAAGLLRLGLGEKIRKILSLSDFTPSRGQGIIAVQARAGDADIISKLAAISDREAAACHAVESAFTEKTGSGCSLPVGACCVRTGSGYTLYGYIGAIDGKKAVKRSVVFGTPDTARGSALAEEMLAAGGKEILDSLKK